MPVVFFGGWGVHVKVLHGPFWVQKTLITRNEEVGWIRSSLYRAQGGHDEEIQATLKVSKVQVEMIALPLGWRGRTRALVSHWPR